jgi:hypothetical protein
MRASTRKVSKSGLYQGVILDGKTVVWQCEHLHRNRDMSPGIRQSARDCALAEGRRRELWK